MVLNQDFREFFQSLNDNRVRYLVVGGYAVALHGHPRYTKDIDIWVELDPENASNLTLALDQFGFASLELQPADFLEPDTVIQLGYPPARIDLLVGLPGASFAECYANRVVRDIDGTTIDFVGREHLKMIKRTAGRPQDLADIAALSEAGEDANP